MGTCTNSLLESSVLVRYPFVRVVVTVSSVRAAHTAVHLSSREKCGWPRRATVCGNAPTTIASPYLLAAIVGLESGDSTASRRIQKSTDRTEPASTGRWVHLHTVDCSTSDRLRSRRGGLRVPSDGNIHPIR